MRWLHLKRGWVLPNVFIPMAEESDVTYGLRAFAAREAETAAASWEAVDTSKARPYISVNLSAHQFDVRGLASKTEGALRTGGLSTERLVIEVIESVAPLNVTQMLAIRGSQPSGRGNCPR